jgi:hypothetical protein
MLYGNPPIPVVLNAKSKMDNLKEMISQLNHIKIRAEKAGNNKPAHPFFLNPKS